MKGKDELLLVLFVPKKEDEVNLSGGRSRKEIHYGKDRWKKTFTADATNNTKTNNSKRKL